MALMLRLLRASILVLFCGCGAATAPVVDEAPDGGRPDAARADGGPIVTDAGRADLGVAPDAGPRPDGLVFRLSFRSDVGAAETIFVQSSTSSHDGPGWLSIQNAAGEELDFVGRCDLCPCASSGGACVGCPRCGPPIDVVGALSGDGTLVEHRWNLLMHTVDTCDAGELAICAAPPAPAPTGDYIATFCWSETRSGEGPDLVGFVTCEEIPFQLPDDDGVVENAVCFCG